MSSTSAAAPASAPTATGYVWLSGEVTFGRSRDNDVCLPDASVSRHHLKVEKKNGRIVARDLGSRTGSRLNGLLIDEAALIYGDALAMGPFTYRFDGRGFERLDGHPGAMLNCRELSKRVRGRLILQDVSLDVPPGEFVGILGTSGAGKSTLLDALGGIRPASSGDVLLNGLPVRSFLRRNLSACGYVPQDDIVHLDLTVREAVGFSAQLRLPGGTSAACLSDCVDRTLSRLGLTDRTDIQVRHLSGGQRKRVSIAAEVLARPSILFLDEPSSGLDPGTESNLMEQLRDLATLGCTVVCTTHVMENVFLFDRLLVLHAGRLIFAGSPQKTREHFGIERFSQLYDRIETQTFAPWVGEFRGFDALSRPKHAPVPLPPPELKRQRQRRPFSLPILLHRQWKLMTSDWKNLVLLVGQPLLIGSLVAWMSETVSFKLFVAYLATFWFGCSNAAQEIVKEAAIYRRERAVGVRRGSYLGAKFLFWSVVTCLQAMLLYLCIQFGGKDLSGSPDWQSWALISTALSSVGIGFALSAWVRSTTQAVMIVPLILLPQIIFSGYVVPSYDAGGAKKVVSQLMPSHASQMIMDTSVLWQETISPKLLKDHVLALKNLDPDEKLEMDDTFVDSEPARQSFVRHALWLAAGWLLAWIGLWKKDQGHQP
jgi:ABC-type multidrug transport system ATPase subunit